MEHSKSVSLSTIEDLQKAVRELNEKIEELKKYTNNKETEQPANVDTKQDFSNKSNYQSSDVNSPSGSNEMSPIQSKDVPSGKEETKEAKQDSAPSVEYGIFVVRITISMLP